MREQFWKKLDGVGKSSEIGKHLIFFILENEGTILEKVGWSWKIIGNLR